MFIFWLKGMVLGFSIAAPVGPIGLLCIYRTLQQGQRAGFVSGLGAASADAVYGSLAAFGLSTVFLYLSPYQNWLQFAGASFLIWLGIRTCQKPICIQQTIRENIGGLFSAYTTTFLLTLSNPATILSFLAVFSGMGLVSTAQQSGQSGVFLVLGVFCGSAFWWLLLSTCVLFLRQKFLNNEKVLRRINRFAGLMLVGFGVLSILNLFPD